MPDEDAPLVALPVLPSCMWCQIELGPGEGVLVRYEAQQHRPSMRSGDLDDWECVDLVACTNRIHYNEQDYEDQPPGPQWLIITATDAEGEPLL